MIKRKLKKLIKDKSGMSLMYVFSVGMFLILITGSLVFLSTATASEFTQKQKTQQLQLYAQSFIQTLNVALSDPSDTGLAHEIVSRMYQDTNAGVPGHIISDVLTSSDTVDDMLNGTGGLNEYLNTLSPPEAKSAIPMSPITVTVSMSALGRNYNNGELIGDNSFFGRARIGNETAPASGVYQMRYDIELSTLTDKLTVPQLLVFDMFVPVRIELIKTVGGNTTTDIYESRARFHCTVNATPTGSGNVTLGPRNEWELKEFG